MTQEVLSVMAPSARRFLAANLGLADSSPESLAAHLASPTRIAAVLAGLTQPERDALTILVLGTGVHVPRDAVQAQLAKLHPGERREPKALRSLERRGLLVPEATFSWQAAMYDVVEGVVADAVIAWMLEACPLRPAPAGAGSAADPAVVVADTGRLLGALDQGARVTKAGDVRKADTRRLAGAFDRGRPSPVPLGSPLREDYDAPVHLGLALLVQLGLIAAVGGQLRPTQAASRWIAMHAAAQWKSLILAWRDLAVAHLGPALPVLIACCGRGGWVDIDRTIRAIDGYIPELSWDGELGHWEPMTALFLQAGLALGALEQAGPELVRLRRGTAAAITGGGVPLADMDEPVIVQPDFEILAPPRAPARVLWDLERWAERIGVDRVARYRITRASVGRCSRSGEPAGKWLGRLAAAAKFGVPDNVRFSVAEWAESACQAEMRPAVVLTFSPAPPPGWKPPAAARRLGEGVWALDMADAPAVLTQLGDRGVQVAGEPEAWRRMAKAGAGVPAAAPSRPSLAWPCPPPGAARTPFADEAPAPPAPPEPAAAVHRPAPAGPAMPRREVRRTLQRAGEARRVVEIETLDGHRCAIVPQVAGDRVAGRCVDCGEDVVLPIGEIQSLAVRRPARR